MRSNRNLLLLLTLALALVLAPPVAVRAGDGEGDGEEKEEGGESGGEGGESGGEGGEGAPAPKPTGEPAEMDLGDEPSDEELKELEGKVDEAEVGVGAEVFDEGVKLYYEKNYAVAAARLWDYMAGNEQGAENFGYAEFFLARSLDELGLSHGAIEYYFNVAKNRTKPELLPDALEAIERISRTRPFDQELILKDLLYDTTFGYLREDLRDFVEYYQGLLDYRNGFIRWGQNHFGKIRKETYYDYKARYVQAVYELVKYNLDSALEMFRNILASDIKQADAINNARQSIARILFEQKKYEEAYEMYETINSPIEKQATVFLEEAWTQYYLKNYPRAMGLLYALEAPAFRRHLSPERFVLKALIYKNLCHYNVAKDAVAEFREKYGDALSSIYDRVDLDRDALLKDGALQEPQLIELNRFRELLDNELAVLGDHVMVWSDNGLLDHLAKIYDLKMQEVDRRIERRLDRSIHAFAEKLLEYEEQMNLLEYEIGLSIFKRIKGTPSEQIEEEKGREIPFYGPRVFYGFDGEFWNDELHDFRFFIEDRCYSEERWE